MMTANKDRRIIRTRQLLREVLLDLATEKEIDTITVKELTDRAGLNRGTFYLHYQDIHDFYEQYKNEILEGYHLIIKKLTYSTERREPFAEPPSGYIRPFEYVLEHKRFFQVFMGLKGDTSFARQMTELILAQFHRSFRVRNKHIHAEDIPLKQQYLFAYLASAYVGTIQFWIQRNWDLTPTDLTMLFSQISRMGSAHVDTDFGKTR